MTFRLGSFLLSSAEPCPIVWTDPGLFIRPPAAGHPAASRSQELSEKLLHHLWAGFLWTTWNIGDHLSSRPKPTCREAVTLLRGRSVCNGDCGRRVLPGGGPGTCPGRGESGRHGGLRCSVDDGTYGAGTSERPLQCFVSHVWCVVHSGVSGKVPSC